jgi:hypothetical protein
MTELSSEAQAMLELARRTDRPRAGDRERVASALAGMGVGAASLAVGPSASAAASSAAIGANGVAHLGSGVVGLGALAGKVVVPGLLGLALGAAVATPIALYETAPPVSTETLATHQVARVATRSDSRPTSGAAPTAAVESPSAVVRSRSAASVSTRGAPAPVPSSKPAANLQAEAALLAKASSAIGSGRAAQALELLDRHEREYADGALAEERAAARVLALCEAGRTDDARRYAEQFLRSAPRSPLVPRVRASCAFGKARAAFDSETETSTTGHHGGEEAK